MYRSGIDRQRGCRGLTIREIFMKRLLSRAAILVFAFSAILAGSAHAATDPAKTVREFYATLTQTMKHGAQLGEKGRYDALSPSIRHSFDLSAMAQMAVGPGWAKLSAAERQDVTEAFARYTVASYADHFGKDDGDKLDVGGTHAMPYGTVVETHIVDPNGDQTAINYLMRENSGQWQVADVYLQGTISQVANLRSQFSAVFQRGGADELIATLNKKALSLNSAAS
jgi:phospholipid transport system substrate-binding protein